MSSECTDITLSLGPTSFPWNPVEDICLTNLQSIGMALGKVISLWYLEVTDTVSFF
jgi:hypothetical protein